MRFHHLLLGVCAGAVVAAAEQPASESKRTLSLEDCFKMALERNLDVQIERLNPEIARYNISMAYAGYEPALTASGTHNFNLSPSSYFQQLGFTVPGTSSDNNTFSAGVSGVLPTGLNYRLSGNTMESYGDRTGTYFKNSSASASISLTQPLLKNMWIDATRMNIQVSKKSLKGSELTLRYQIMATISSVEQAYYDLVSAYENVKVQEQALQLSNQLLKDNQYKVKVGVLAPLDEKQAQSQVASSEASLLSARLTLLTQQNSLKRLIHDQFSTWNEVEIIPSTPLTVPVMVFSLQDSWHKGMTQRPDLLQYRVELEKQDVVLRYRRNQLWPELDLVGSYGHSGNSTQLGGMGGQFSDSLDMIRMGNAPSYAYGGQLTIPLGNRSARMNYKAGKAQKQQMVLRMKKMEEDVLVQIDNAVKQCQIAAQQTEATKQATVYAQAALEAEQKKLENGKSTPFVVLQLQRDLTSARSAEIAAKANYDKALSALALAEGATLERSNLKVTIK